MTTAPRLIREQLLALAESWLERECKDKNECVGADGKFRSETHRAAWNFADGLGTAGSELKRSLAAEPVSGEDHGMARKLRRAAENILDKAPSDLTELLKEAATCIEIQFSVTNGMRQAIKDLQAESASQPDSAEGEHPKAEGGDWLRDGGLLYRITDGRRPQNRDEINVTMADGSRYLDERERRAMQLQAMLSAAPQPEQLGSVGTVLSGDSVSTTLTQPEQPARDGVVASAYGRPWRVPSTGGEQDYWAQYIVVMDEAGLSPGTKLYCQPPQQADAGAKTLADDLASDGLEHYAERALSLSGDGLRSQIKRMVEMLENGEWAEHVSDDPDIQRLEVQITSLIPQQADGGAVEPNP